MDCRRPHAEPSRAASTTISANLPESPSESVGVTALCGKELPIRLAQRIMQLENLPLGLPNMPTIKQVRRAAAFV